MLGHEAVILNWRLFWRSLRQSSGAPWIVIAVALLAASIAGRPAADLGSALASQHVSGESAAVVLGLWLWRTFLAGFAFALAAGELSFIRHLHADLAWRPVSRWQTCLAAQAVWTTGPPALVTMSAGLPWLVVLLTWLNGAQLLTAIAATFVMMRLPAGVLVSGSRLLSAPRAIAGPALAVVSAVAAVPWLAAPDLLLIYSPPGLVVRILLDDGASSAWAGLGLWTLTAAALEVWSAGLDAAPRPGKASRAVETQPIPLAVAFAARLTGCHAMLLHGELLRLIRWRRYQLTLLAGVFLVAAIGARTSEDTGPIHAVVLSLLPVSIGGSVLANIFASDRFAFHTLLTAPAGLAAVVRAKVIAILHFSMTGQLAGAVFLLARGVELPLVAAATFLGAGFFMWVTAIGLLTSVLFASPSDPRTVGGALVNTPAFIAVALGNGVFFAAAVGVAYMLEWRLWSWPIGSAAVAALLAAALVAMLTASQVSSRLIATRQEAMLFALTAPGVRT